MCTPTTLADSETLLLAITCVSLGISSKTVFNNIGLLTNLYVRATKSPVVKNERRWIKLAQSDPFPTAGRPPTLNFGLVYTSETFDDVPDIAPSLLARVRRNDGMDSKLRLSGNPCPSTPAPHALDLWRLLLSHYAPDPCAVYYSSNLTGGKEVLLSATTFSERELLRAVSVSGVLISEMSAEYCTGYCSLSSLSCSADRVLRLQGAYPACPIPFHAAGPAVVPPPADHRVPQRIQPSERILRVLS